MMVAQEIQSLREQIDRIDREIVELLNQRARAAVEIGYRKSSGDLNTFDPVREMKVIDSLSPSNGGPLPDTSLKHIFAEIISACRALQRPVQVAYLGPEATFTHMAAITHFGRACSYVPKGSIIDIFRDVEKGHVQCGVVPVENSAEGAVNITLDCLAHSDLKIIGEILLPISHVLMARESDLRRIETVFSHPQALSQCWGWLHRNLPNRTLVEVSSTAAAAQKAMEGENGGAAVGSELAARTYGLEVLAKDIQDNPNNLTRFIVLGNTLCPTTGRDKTSILFVAAHRPGSLYRALQPFAAEGINLARIESRPTKERPWEYIFFVDFEGHLSEEGVDRTLRKLESRVHLLKVLGSYPMGGPQALNSCHGSA